MLIFFLIILKTSFLFVFEILNYLKIGIFATRTVGQTQEVNK